MSYCGSVHPEIIGFVVSGSLRAALISMEAKQMNVKMRASGKSSDQTRSILPHQRYSSHGLTNIHPFFVARSSLSPNMTPLSCLLYLLGIHVTHTLAGPCLSVWRDPDNCPQKAAQPSETPPIWQTCPSGPANGAQWACQASDIDFPTVACLVADMKTCGLIGAGGRNTVFYSFGAPTAQARTKFRDTLSPKGVMFNDALDADYWNKVVNLTRFHMDQSTRKPVLVARYAEAMATASTGEVFVVVQKYNGDRGGKGAYQLPTDTTNPNMWRAYVFPTLQRNSAVTSVTSVDLSDNLNRHVDWQPNNNDPELPASGASGLVVPPPPPGCPQKVKRKRAAAACVTCITLARSGGLTDTVSVSDTVNMASG